MPPRNSQRLELTWFNKDMALVPIARGNYGYSWVDPRDPRYCEVHPLVETGTVEGSQAAKAEGVEYSDRADLTPTTDNLLIHGDSGDVLEALHQVPELAEKYVGQVKLVYLDPPFNSAEAFTQSSYEDNLEHSIWLTMMRDRVLHIRELLTYDGSIWIHLDDREVHRMRCLLDEVFGADHFVAEVVWQKRTSRENRAAVSDSHDVILVYSRGPVDVWKAARNRLERSIAEKNLDNDPRGPWDSVPFTAQGTRPNQMYTITTPTGVPHQPPPGRCWGALESEYLRLKADGRIHFPKKGNGRPRVKQFVSEAPGLVPHTLWLASEVGDNDSAKKGLMAMFPGQDAFATPKPERLLERIIHIATDPGDLVLDVFAGSGTTAAVAHKMGRRWVAAELLGETIDKFTLPRLTSVVNGTDMGGISTTTVRVPTEDADLPEGMTPKDAQAFYTAYGKVADTTTAPVDVAKATAKLVRERVKSQQTTLDESESKELLRLLRKLGKDDPAPEVDLLPDVSKHIRMAAQTTENTVVNWRGGGSFRVLELSPDVYDYNPALQLVTLTDAAHGETLIASVAANLGFTRTPDDHPFHGRRGKMRLVVVQGTVTEQAVDDVLAHLPADERVTIAALGVPDGVRKYLRQLSRGSVIKHVPDDLFPYSGDSSNPTSEG